MLLTRAAISAARPKPAILAHLQRRPASSSSHGQDEHHHDEHHDTTQYPKEGFNSAVWGYSLLGALGVVAFYKYAPAPGEDNYITRYIAYYSTPKDIWESINYKHLELAHEASEDTLLIRNAQPPIVHRFRYPQSFEQCSAYCIPVGGDPDLSGLKIKSDSV